MREVNINGDTGHNVRRLIASMAVSLALALGAIFSASGLATRFSSPAAYSHQIERLDAKKETVMRLSVASATASAAISLIPDDACTPIAEQLAGISKDFAVVLAAILLEKYLLTTLGFVLFAGIVPACLAALAVAALLPQRSGAKAAIMAVAVRVLLAGTVVWASVPASVFLTERIEETYAASIDAAIESADQADLVAEREADRDEADGGLLGRMARLLTSPRRAASDAGEKARELLQWAKGVLGSFVEGLAVMVVTTCVIPALTPLGALWLLRLVLAPIAPPSRGLAAALRARD